MGIRAVDGGRTQEGKAMASHFTTEIGRMRNDEAIARAERYRTAALAARRRESRLEPSERTLPVKHPGVVLFGFLRRAWA